MVTCGLLLVAALALAIRWRKYTFTPQLVATDSVAARLRGLVRLLAVGALTGLVVGALVIGPAGRLAMRLLAATSPDAEGQETEAEEVIGQITVAGTIGFVVFVGIFFGLAVGLLYVFVSRAFPRGLVGGAVYGATLLVLFSWWQDPLVPENKDFDILSPGWLAVVAFTVMAVGTGAITAPIAGRLGAALRGPKLWWVVWLGPLGLLSLGAVANVALALWVVVLGSLAYLLLPDAGKFLRQHGQLALRLVVGAAVLVALPGFVAAVVDIA
jgi:hypothetical protein